MAKITDHTLLAQTTDIVFNTAAKTIQVLSTGAVNINDGVTGQAVYSFCKAQWKADAALIKFPFPFISITEQKFDLINGWDWADNATRALIRDAGWAVKDASNVSLEEWAGIITLGSFVTPAAETAYYQQAVGGTTTNMGHTGPVNEAVKIYGDATHGNVDYRNYFKIFLREYQRTYDESDLTAIGISSMTYQVYAFPLANAVDLNIANNDTTVAAYPISLTYGAIVRNTKSFDKLFASTNATTATLQQLYEYSQYLLRQSTDIDAGAGTVIGKTAATLLTVIGSTLSTSTGVYIDNYAAADSNSIDFHDTAGALYRLPYTAAGTLEFNSNLANDASASYWMFFTDPTATSGDEFGTAGAIIVNDAAGNPISGNVAGNATIAFDFDYDGNVQGGRTAGIDAAVTVVAIGLTTGQYVSATSTLTRSKSNKISLVAALERNYV